ncbi:MAG: heterocyst frequency control protein PatD [Cyanobacteria bacterium J06638_20]
MLPAELKPGYAALRETLGEMQGAIASTPDPIQLQAQFKTAQTQFQQEILTPSADLALPSAVQSAQTEVNRLMRLLGTDVTFLRSAKQADTQAKRLGQVSDRLSRLLEFCDGLLSAPEEPCV